MMRHFLVLAAVLLISSCTTREEDTDIELLKPCYFIDNPGVDSVISKDSGYLEYYKDHAAGELPAGTKLIDLGAREESDLIITKTNRYARIATGAYKGRKISFDYLYLDNLKSNDIYKHIEKKGE